MSMRLFLGLSVLFGHQLFILASYAGSCDNVLGALELGSMASPTSHERIEIRYGTLQFPPNQSFSVAQYVSHYYYFQDPLGDRLEVHVLPGAGSYAMTRQVNPAIPGRDTNFSTRKVILTNYGLQRYFWLQPDEEQQYVPARVLDIHLMRGGGNAHGDRFVFLVEHLATARGDGLGMRRVHQLSPTEFLTLQEEMSGNKRVDAAQAFIARLNSNELLALQLAEKLKLKLYGYVDARRSPGRYVMNVPSPLEYMNNISHLAIKSYSQRTYPFLLELLTSIEKGTPNFNYIDFYARLDPRLVVTKFGGIQYSTTEFNWVITEDGQLKIMPTMDIGNNLRPSIFRLASGRKIFAGGRLQFRYDGGVDVELNANGYQQLDAQWGSSGAFQEQNYFVNNFVQVVIEMQTGYKVHGLQVSPIDSWHFSGSPADDHSSPDFFSTQSQGQDWEEVFNTMKDRAQHATHPGRVNLSWDQKKETPLDLDEYGKQMQADVKNLNLQMDWAHYVLQTNRTMSWEQIKLQYRRMNMIYHPDRQNPQVAANRSKVVMAMLNRAIAILETQLKMQ